MKKIVVILAFIVGAATIAQNTNTVEFEQQKINLAKKFADKTLMTSAMYNIILLEGAQSNYKDSLAYMYFNARNYISCYLVTKDILERKPDNLELLEMNAISLESIGALDNATKTYTDLLSRTNNNYHAYKLAGLQFGMKKFDEALVTIKKSDALPDTGDMQVTFKVNENYNQNVALKAAIAYLQGIIELSLSNKAAAKISFERAVELFPDFVLAKGKLSIMMAEEEEKK